MTERTPELLNYFLTCPAARIEAHLLERDHTPVGYFLLSRTARECRIADLWIRSADGSRLGGGLCRRNGRRAHRPRHYRYYCRGFAAAANRRARKSRLPPHACRTGVCPGSGRPPLATTSRRRVCLKTMDSIGARIKVVLASRSRKIHLFVARIGADAMQQERILADLVQAWLGRHRRPHAGRAHNLHGRRARCPAFCRWDSRNAAPADPVRIRSAPFEPAISSRNSSGSCNADRIGWVLVCAPNSTPHAASERTSSQESGRYSAGACSGISARNKRGSAATSSRRSARLRATARSARCWPPARRDSCGIQLESQYVSAGHRDGRCSGLRAARMRTRRDQTTATICRPENR